MQELQENSQHSIKVRSCADATDVEVKSRLRRIEERHTDLDSKLQEFVRRHGAHIEELRTHKDKMSNALEQVRIEERGRGLAMRHVMGRMGDLEEHSQKTITADGNGIRSRDCTPSRQESLEISDSRRRLPPRTASLSPPPHAAGWHPQAEPRAAIFSALAGHSPSSSLVTPAQISSVRSTMSCCGSANRSTSPMASMIAGGMRTPPGPCMAAPLGAGARTPPKFVYGAGIVVAAPVIARIPSFGQVVQRTQSNGAGFISPPRTQVAHGPQGGRT